MLGPFWQEVHKGLEKVFQFKIPFNLESLYLGVLPSENVTRLLEKKSDSKKFTETVKTWIWWLDWHYLWSLCNGKNDVFHETAKGQVFDIFLIFFLNLYFSVVFLRLKNRSPVTLIVLDLAGTLFTPETPKVFCGLKHFTFDH